MAGETVFVLKFSQLAVAVAVCFCPHQYVDI